MQAASFSAPLVLHGHRRRAPSTSLFGGAADEYRDLEKQLAEWFFKLSLQCVPPSLSHIPSSCSTY
jgi:7-keto-8-aminopelargonate synthetase-like enzyme